MATDDKLKDDLIKQFNKEFPDSPLEEMTESALAEVPGWITTGNYALNWIISKDMFKGLPLGRVVMFAGDASSGKSMISLSMMREPSIDYIVYFDSEGGGVSKQFASFLGINTDKVLYAPIDTVEGLISRFKKIIETLEANKSDKKVLMVVDSISMLTTDKEKDPNAGADMGNRAKTTRSFFRQYIRRMQKLNICAVFTGHLTENIGGYGPSKVVAGGTILGYAPSVEVRFAVVNAESEKEQSAVGSKMKKIRAEIHKSRLGTDGKRVKFDLDMQRGLDQYAGISDILRDYGILIPAAADFDKQVEEKEIPKRSTGWWAFKPWEKKSGALHDRLIKEGLATSGKFRETKIKEWGEQYDWFLPEVQKLLDSIYEDEEDEASEQDSNAEKSDNSEKKTAKNAKKKTSAVEITEVSGEEKAS